MVIEHNYTSRKDITIFPRLCEHSEVEMRGIYILNLIRGFQWKICLAFPYTVYNLYYTGFSSQGRAKFLVFRAATARKSTQPSPSFTRIRCTCTCANSYMYLFLGTFVFLGPSLSELKHTVPVTVRVFLLQHQP